MADQTGSAELTGSDELRAAGRGGVATGGHPDTGHADAGHEVATGHEPVEHEKPEDWGWHADFGRLARIAGWLSVLALLSMVGTTHYNNSGTGALLLTAGVNAIMLCTSPTRAPGSRRCTTS